MTCFLQCHFNRIVVGKWVNDLVMYGKLTVSGHLHENLTRNLIRFRYVVSCDKMKIKIYFNDFIFSRF